MGTQSGLVLQLQHDAMDSSVLTTDLLRKAKAVAVKLKQDELAQWLENEMCGYNDVNVPEYRKLHARVQFFNPVRGWCPVVGGDHELPFCGSIAEIAALLAGEGEIVSPAPVKLIQQLSRQVGFEVDARRVIPRPAVAAIPDAIRNTIHDWALRLEAAGILGEGLSFSQREAERAQSVVVNIGSIGNATGIGGFGDNATITSHQKIDVKQFAQEALDLVDEAETALPASGLPEATMAAASRQLKELKRSASATKPDDSRIRRALMALQRTMEGAAGNLVATGILTIIARLLAG